MLISQQKPRITINASVATLYSGFILAAIYAFLVCKGGIPSLRHDWAWPDGHTAFIDAVVSSTAGWSNTGLGAPYSHPGAYLFGTLLGIIGLAFGSLATLMFFALSISSSIAFGARQIGSITNASTVQILALQIFALFNPWVYNKTVAGHLYMLLAYGGCALLCSELQRPVVHRTRIAAIMLLILPQLQFFVVAIVALLVHAYLRRVALPLISTVIVSSPVWLGILLDRANLLHTPYTLVWETSQSVAPSNAPTLTGYFTHYATAHLAIIQYTAMWAIVAFSMAAVVFSKRRTAAIISAIVAILLLIFATGARGPLGTSYIALVLHLPESGVFRELYDVLGLVAIAYLVMLACMPARFWVVNAATLIAAGIAASAWFTYPPSNYFVCLDEVPRLTIDAPQNTRFALLPAYQPLRFNGRGSGADPDVYDRPANVTPLNEYFAGYPVNAALSQYELTGDTGPLQALSVSLIVKRPWLQSDARALRLQGTGVPPLLPTRTLTYKHIVPMPELALQSTPLVAGLASQLGAGNIFFGDARLVRSDLVPLQWKAYSAFHESHVPNVFVDAARGWTSVEFAFSSHPSLAQGVGGVITTNSQATLPVQPGMNTLVDINGKLLAPNGAVLTKSTWGYRWITIPPSIKFLRCSGQCVVVGQTDMQNPPPLNPPARTFTAVSFQMLTPWLLRGVLPPHGHSALRYNVAFDPNWTILGANGAHVKIDATVNGWLLSDADKPNTIYLYDRAAVIQMASELVAVFWALGLGVTKLAIRKPRITMKSKSTKA